MQKLLVLALLATALVGCGSNEPRDATNDPEVQAMLKHVEQEGKPMGGAPAGGPSGAPSGAPTTP